MPKKTKTETKATLAVALSAGIISPDEGPDFARRLMTSDQEADAAVAELRMRVDFAPPDPSTARALPRPDDRSMRLAGRAFGADDAHERPLRNGLDAPTVDGRGPYEGGRRRGQTPVATASGIPVEALDAIHWSARQVVADEPDRAAAYRMLQEFRGDDGAVFALADDRTADVRRIWDEQLAAARVAVMSDDEIAAAVFPDDDPLFQRTAPDPWANARPGEADPGADRAYRGALPMRPGPTEPGAPGRLTRDEAAGRRPLS